MNRFTRPEFAWPATVVALLLLGIGLTLGVFWFARSDGGAQVVDHYYRDAVAWDSISAVRTRVDDLGWDIIVTTAPSPDKSRVVEALVTDSTGTGLEGLRIEIRAYRPSMTRAVSVAPAADSAGGRYVAVLHIDRPGLWDFEVSGTTVAGPFVVRARREIVD